MEIKLTGYEAIELIEKYYTDLEWPVKNFQIFEMMYETTNDEGSARTDWDIIDLQNKELIRISDYTQGEYGFSEDEGKQRIPEEFQEEYGNYYLYLLEMGVSPYGSKIPTCIEVSSLIQNILIGELNTRGYKRKQKEKQDE